MTIIYKSYIIEAYERETGRWRATISRQDGTKIRIAVPPAEHLQVVTSADADVPRGSESSEASD
jgi:hypothetical protein